MESKEWKVWRAYAGIIRAYKGLFVVMSVLMVITVLTKFAVPFLLRDILDALISGQDVTGWIWIYGIAIAAHNLVWLAYDPVITQFETYCMRDIDRKTLDVLQRQSARFYESSFTGSLVTSAKRLRHTLEFVTDMYVFQFGRLGVMIVFATIVFALHKPIVGVGFAAWSALYLYVNYRLALLRMEREEIAADADSAVGGALADTLSNNHAVRSYAREAEEQAQFDAVTEDCRTKRARAWLFAGYVNRTQGILVGVLELGILFFLVSEWNRGALTPGDFLFYQSFILLALQHLWEVAGAMNKVFRHLADASEMAEIYERQPEVQDAPGAVPLDVEQEEAKIEYHAVNFSYGENARMAVCDFSLTIEPGETVAIVGPSGAGKSTLVKLLQRQYDPNSGYIRVGHQYITNVTQQSLRQHIALVPQDTNLFHRTLRENIAVGRPDATEEEIIDAAVRAQAWEFIRYLDKGLDTLVGERGVKLSGGERQRIALARAFLADRPILVLDEATSALDSITERLMQKAIAELLKGRTSIVIAHRLSTIMRANRIVVMNQGTFVDVAPHDQLLQRSRLYRDLWEHQVNGYLPA